MISFSLHIPLQAGTTRVSTPVQSTAPLRAHRFTISSFNTSEILSRKSEMPSPKSEMMSRKSEMLSPKCEMTSPKFEMMSRKSEMASRQREMTSRKCEMPSPKSEMPSPKCEMTSYFPVFNFCPDNRQLCLYNFDYKTND